MVNREPMVLDFTGQGQHGQATKGEPDNDVAVDTNHPVCTARPPLQDCTNTIPQRKRRSTS